MEIFVTTFVVLGALIAFGGGLWMAVLAFRLSLLWGLSVLLIPGVGLFFMIRYWDEARQPLFTSLAGGAVVFVGVFLGAAVGSHPLQPSVRPRRPLPVTDSEASLPGDDGFGDDAPQGRPDAGDELAAPTPPSRPSVDWRRSLEQDVPPLRPLRGTRIALADLERHVGEYLEIVTKDEKTVRATLVGVSPTSLQVSQHFGSGSISFRLPRANIKEVRRASSR